MRLGRLLPSPIRRRYAAKFGVAVLLTVIVIAAVGGVGYAQVQSDVQQDTEAQLRSTATLQANALGDWVRSTKLQTRLISAAKPVTEGDNRAVQSYITSAQSRAGQTVVAIHYVDTANRRIVRSTDPTLDETPLSAVDQPWASDRGLDRVRGLSERGVAVSNRSFSTGVFDQVVAFVSPVEGRQNRAIVLVSALRFRVDDLEQRQTGQATGILNVDGEAVLVGQNRSIGTGGNVNVTVPQSRLAEASRSGTAAFSREGEYAVAYAPVPNTNWVAVTTVPVSEAFTLQRAVGRSVGLIVVVSLLSLLAFGGAIARDTVRPLGELRDRAKSMENEELDVDLETDREDEIGRLYGAFDSMRVSLREQIQEAERAREEAERARREAERFNEHLERKAQEYRTVMQACADGDLTRRVDPDSESEAMREIGEEFNATIDEFERVVANLRAFASDVAASSEEVTASAEEVQSASQDVTRSVEAISEDAKDQNERFQSVSAEMESLSTSTEEIAGLTNEVANLAERTAETGREGREAAQQAIAGMKQVRAESNEAAEEIERLEAEMEEIDELIEFINDVADQTNMLALNANIEASRGGGGGGDGGGFGVVADEIKDLADETKDATEDIERRLERIKEQTSRTNGVVQGAAERVAEQTETIEGAAEALDEIAGYAEETNDGVQEISAATQQQAASTEEVVAMVEEATGVSERTADEAQKVAASAEEQTVAMSEVSESASELSRRASELSKLLGEFGVEVTPEGMDAPVQGDPSPEDD